jgi:F-type H+-transporting ATPase subunit delta
MSSNRAQYYAEAFHAIASAEGDLATVEAELSAVSQAIAANDGLRTSLSDPAFPAAQRQQVIEDLFGGKVSATTTALVSMLVAGGRIGELADIVSALVGRSAAGRNKVVAEVRSAVPLTADQSARLGAALKTATGKDVEVKVVIDPSVLGGIVTQIGDTVIDGSVRHRLDKMREALA